MITHFDVTLYEYRIHVMHAATDTEFNSYIKKVFNADIDRSKTTASVWQMENVSGGRESVMDFRVKIQKDLFSLNTIVHECQHVVMDIMNYIGMPCVYDVTDEAFCYLMAHITEKVYEIIHKKYTR